HAPFESAESAGIASVAGPESVRPACRYSGSQGESTRMDAESTLPAVVQAEPVVGAPSGRYTENAMLGWTLGRGVTLVGYFLLALGSSVGAPGWPRHLFLAIGLAG